MTLSKQPMRGKRLKAYRRHLQQMTYEERKAVKKRGRRMAIAAILAYLALIAFGGWHP